MTDVPPPLTRPSRRRGVYTAIIALLVIGPLVAAGFLVALLRDLIAVRHIPVPTLPGDGPISLALTGDTTRLSAATQADAAYLAVANAVRRASLGFTNLELSLPNPEGSTEPPPAAGNTLIGKMLAPGALPTIGTSRAVAAHRALGNAAP